MADFEPDYNHIVNAARNIKPQRLPQYDHIVDAGVMEQLLDRKFAHLGQGELLEDRRTFWQEYALGLRSLGYDVVIFEGCVTEIINGGKSLIGKEPGPIQSETDYAAFPWDALHDRYFSVFDEQFTLLRETMPDGMRAVGGVGNGVFEILQDFVRYSELCMMMLEKPDLFEKLIKSVGDMPAAIWQTFMRKYGDSFCLLRFGDDLGFKNNTLISDTHIREYIIPQYRRILDIVHSYEKPFLLHSCGKISSVMDDLIRAGIDAKHSNEDEIARFSFWTGEYGDSIGNFGGVDMNVLVTGTEESVREYTLAVIEDAIDSNGFACGSGNSIPDYVPPRNYGAMLKAIQEYRESAR